MLRQTLQTEAVKRLVDTCFTKYPDGLVTNVQKGQVPAQYQSLAHSVAKYVVSPPSPSGVSIAMMGTGSRIITAPTVPHGWNMKP
jgi:hypothetical protein